MRAKLTRFRSGRITQLSLSFYREQRPRPETPGLFSLLKSRLCLDLRTCAGVLVSWSIARSSEEIDGVRDHMTILLIAVPFEVSCDSGMPANMYLITPLFRRSLRSFQGC